MLSLADLVKELGKYYLIGNVYVRRLLFGIDFQ